MSNQFSNLENETKNNEILLPVKLLIFTNKLNVARMQEKQPLEPPKRINERNIGSICHLIQNHAICKRFWYNPWGK